MSIKSITAHAEIKIAHQAVLIARANLEIAELRLNLATSVANEIDVEGAAINNTDGADTAKPNKANTGSVGLSAKVAAETAAKKEALVGQAELAAEAAKKSAEATKKKTAAKVKPGASAEDVEKAKAEAKKKALAAEVAEAEANAFGVDAPEADDVEDALGFPEGTYNIFGDDRINLKYLSTEARAPYVAGVRIADFDSERAASEGVVAPDLVAEVIANLGTTVPKGAYGVTEFKADKPAVRNGMKKLADKIGSKVAMHMLGRVDRATLAADMKAIDAAMVA